MYHNPEISAFMDRYPSEGLTFDDVTLVTQYADFLPAETSISTRLTSRITLNTPFVSAAMDTVTESNMAIAMAMLGGIGVIHKNLQAADQVRQVRQVKNHLNGLIQSQPVLPIAMQSGPAASVLAYERQHGLAWNSVVDPDGRIARHFGISATPSFVVLDAQGNISSSTVGLTSPWGLRLRLWRARLAG